MTIWAVNEAVASGTCDSREKAQEASEDRKIGAYFENSRLKAGP